MTKIWIIALTARAQRGKKSAKTSLLSPANDYLTPRIYGAFFYCKVTRVRTYYVTLQASFNIFKKSKWPQFLQLSNDPVTGDPAAEPVWAAQAIEVRVQVYARARNFRLRISSNGEPVLSVPARGNIKDAKEFLNRQKGWLIKRLNERPEPVAFIDGAQFPIRAQVYQIFGTGKLRGQVEILTHEQEILLKTPKLLVPGGEKHMARRLRDWLKKEAYDDLEKASRQHAKTLGVSFSSISIKGQSSRWGSCSSAGRINYNWRLIMAPDFVLDYVAAHEVAHLCEMNHSKAFWDKVRLTLPQMERGRDWLKENGNQLMAYGVEIKKAATD